MHTSSFALPVNPPSENCVLTREELWAALAMKAEDAIPFLPMLTKCEVIDRGERDGQGWVLREVGSMGREFREHVVLRAPTQVHFALVDGGGFIENTISEAQDGLWLAFTFGVAFPGVEAGSAEERAKAEGMRSGQMGAVASTLARARELKREGRLGTPS